MTGRKRKTFIVDACVLIDYLNADISILKIFAKIFGEVGISIDSLNEEVDGLEVADCYQEGIAVYESSTEQLLAAGSRKGRHGLSFYDWLLFLMARDNGWTAVTNDAALIRECRSAGVEVIGALRPLIELVLMGKVARKKGVMLVKRMIAANEHLGKEYLTMFKEAIKPS